MPPRRWWIEPPRQPAPRLRAASAPAFAFAQVAVALAACLLIVVAGGTAAYYGNRFLAAEQALKATYLNQPVEWDAGEGKPIFTVGSTVVVKGRARSGVVDKLRVLMSRPAWKVRKSGVGNFHSRWPVR